MNKIKVAHYPKLISHARLFAAAPELFKALERIIHGMEDDPKDSNSLVAGEISNGELRQARAAIAKAQGKQGSETSGN